MARQVSLVKFEGKIGDLSFYKSKFGHQARMKSGPTKEQINNDPRFQRTKENGQEFGRAANAAKQLREQLRTLLAQGADTQFSNRLTSRMHRILKADQVNERGERRVLVSNLPLLIGTEANLKAQLGEVFFLGTRPAFDRATGEGVLELPEMAARTVIKGLAGATHVQFQIVVAEFDANSSAANAVAVGRSSYIDIGKSELTAPETLRVELQPQAGSAVIVLMGISYFQEVNSGYYPLSNGQYNALTIVDVDLP